MIINKILYIYQIHTKLGTEIPQYIVPNFKVIKFGLIAL